jgi:uncharacterized membrane protein YqaE (UPF0057 family)
VFNCLPILLSVLRFLPGIEHAEAACYCSFWGIHT